MRYTILIFIAAFLCFRCAEPQIESKKEIETVDLDFRAEKQAILNVLERQRASWNNGDLEDFMQHYWKSDSMMFMVKSGIRYGWQTTLDNYKKSYPTPDSMGVLQFTVKHLDILSKESAYLLGQWDLLVDTISYGGHFSLIWKKVNGKWLIVTDHTS